MNCHKLIYKPYRKTAPYQDFIRRQKQKQQQNRKELFYEEIIKFRQSRYPLDFLKQLEGQINPFQLSLEKLKQLFSQRHPQYSTQLVNQSVEHIFNRKCQQSQMIKQSAIVIQDGDQYIRNGRKLIKQDFSFNFSNLKLPTDGNQTQDNFESSSKKTPPNNNPESFFNSKKKNENLNKGGTGIASITNANTNNGITPVKQLSSTDRHHPASDRLPLNQSRTDSPSKIMDLMKRAQRFNQLLIKQIKKDKQRFQNLQQIQEGAHNDSIHYNYQHQINSYTDRSRQNESLNTFKQQDLIVRPDVLDTGRSQVQQLNFLLTSMNFEQNGAETRRSGRSQKQLRINRQIKEQLYTAKGSLKLDLVRRAIQQLKKQNKMSNPGDTSSRINRN